MVISVNPNIGNTNVVNISNVIFSDKMDLNHVVDSMKKMMKHIEKNMLKKVTKFRISYLGDEKREPDFIKGIKKAGFVLEATLNNETENENLYMYCLELV